MAWTLADIRAKIRKVTGRLSANNLSNQEIDAYINNYYRFTFPQEVTLNRNISYWSFYTEPNVEFYDLPTDFINFEGEISVNNFPMRYYINPRMYYGVYPQSFTQSTLGTGDGVTINFILGSQNNPTVKGSAFVSDGVEVISDNGDGTMTGDLGGIGTINYLTGQINVVFNTAPANGSLVRATFLPYQAAQPWIIFAFNNQFQLYPIPDQTYLIKGIGYKAPPALTLSTDTPLYEQWGPLIAYGAARDIVSDLGELDRYAEITALYKEQVTYALRRTLEDFSSQRTFPQF